MKLTVTKSLTLKTKNGPKTFNPGETFEVDIEKAKPFIEQGLLKKVEAFTVKTGDLIEWESSLLGKNSGLVKEILGEGVLVVDHPLNDRRFGPATIRSNQVTRVVS